MSSCAAIRVCASRHRKVGCRALREREAVILPRCGQPFHEEGEHLVETDPLLLHRVAFSDRHCLVGQGLPVDGYAEWRAGLVLPAVPPADRALLVVKDLEMPLEVLV